VIGFCLMAALWAGVTDSVSVPEDSSSAGRGEVAMGFPLVWQPEVDSSLARLRDSTNRGDSLKELQFATTVVKGAKRYRRELLVDPDAWAKPSAMGLPGAMESLREQQGVAFSGELSGHFSSTGMPVEGSAVTWNGARILWPWHFGGMFGGLDDWATGTVRWTSLGGDPGPSRGGGWLETDDRAWSDSNAVHAAARLGFVAGGAAVWGRRGDWGWQLTGRRTWLDAALDLAKDQAWTEQEMKVMFQDGTAALNWRHGPWSASVGWYGSEDTLGIKIDPEAEELVGISWQNLSVPVRLSWRQGPWHVRSQASWSRYRRVDMDMYTVDTLELAHARLAVERSLGKGRAIEIAANIDSWWSVHEYHKWDALRAWTGDTDRIVLEPTIGYRQAGQGWELRSWLGFANARHDPFSPQAGLSLEGDIGKWNLALGAERKLVVLSLLDQAQRQIDAPSPAWVLPPGSAGRSTQFQLRGKREERDARSGIATRLAGMGWYRLHEGGWNWTLVDQRGEGKARFETSRWDGWSTGVEVDGRIGFSALEISGRQILSMDVLRDREIDGFRPPSRWAPWDQRWRTEFDLQWAWIGEVRPQEGRFYCGSGVAAKRSTGLARSKVVAWNPPDYGTSMDVEWSIDVYGTERTPYFRVDLTPLRMGREGRWAFWWTLVNLTNQTNLMGWVNNGPGAEADPVSQIPFLPVVFGVQVEI
jgi:hypothetical protein